MRLYSTPPLAPPPNETSWKSRREQLEHLRGGDSGSSSMKDSSPNRSVSFRVNESASRKSRKQQQHPTDHHWDEQKQDVEDSSRPPTMAASSPSSSSWKKGLGREHDHRTAANTSGTGSHGSPGRSRSHHRSHHHQTTPPSQQRHRRRRSRDRVPQQQQHQRSASSSSLVLNTSSTTAGSTLSGTSNGTGGSISAGGGGGGSNASSSGKATRNSSSSSADKEDTAWRKPGRSFRARLILHDEKQGDNNGKNKNNNNRLVALSTECSIEKYYRVADKVLDQFLQHPIDTRQDMLEAYLLGTRLCKFLSSMLPTHPDYFVGASFDESDSEGKNKNKNKNKQRKSSPLHEELDASILTAARKRSQEQLTDLLQYVEELALIVDREEHQAYISRVLDPSTSTSTSPATSTSTTSAAIQLQNQQHPSSTIITTEEEEEALNNTTMASSMFSLQQLKLQQLEAKRLERDKKKREQLQMQTTSRRSPPSMTSSSFQEEKKENDDLGHSTTPPRNVSSKTSALTSSVTSSHQHSDLSSRALASSTMTMTSSAMASSTMGSSSKATSTQPPSPAATSTSTSSTHSPGPEHESPLEDDLFWSCNAASTTVLAQQQQPPTPCGPSMRIDPSDGTSNINGIQDNSFSNRLLAKRTNLRSTPSPTKSKTLISNLDRVQEEHTCSPSTKLLALSHLASNDTSNVTVGSSFNSESPLLQRDNSESTIEVKHVAGTDWDVAWSRAGGSSPDAARSRRDKKKKDLASLTRSMSPSSATTTSSAASSIYSDEFKRKTDAEEAAARQEWTPLKSADSFEKTGLLTPPRQTISMRSAPPDSPFRHRSGHTPPKLDDSHETDDSDDTEKILASSRRPKRKQKKKVILFPVEEEPALVVAKDGSLIRNSPRASITNTLPIIEDTNEPFQDDDTMDDLNFCSPPYVYEGAPLRLEAMAETAGDSWDSSAPGCWKKRLQRTHQHANSLGGIDVTPEGYDDPFHLNESSSEYIAASPTHPLEFDDWKHGPWANIRSSSSSTVSTNRSGQPQSLPSPKILRKMRYCKKFLDMESASETTSPPENSDNGIVHDGSSLDQSMATMATTRKQRAIDPFKMCVKCLLE